MEAEVELAVAVVEVEGAARMEAVAVSALEGTKGSVVAARGCVRLHRVSW